MMYRYTVYTGDRKVIQGTLEGASIAEAEESLYRAGYQRILKLQKADTSLDLKKLLASPPRITPETLLEFTSELVVLTESGLTLLTALKQLEKQSTNKSLKNVVARLEVDIQSGMQFHQALSLHPQVFSESYCSVMQANEKAGTLDSGLRQIAKQLKQQIATKSQIQKAVTQPAIIICLAIVVAIILVVVVLPPLADVFRQFGTQLPWTTRFLIGLSDYIKSYGVATLLILMALVLALVLLIKRPKSKSVIDKLIFKIPLIGQVIVWNSTAQFSRSLSNLLGAGILLPDGINIMLRGINNSYFRQALGDARKSLLQGQSFSSVMGQNKLFPSLLVEMIGVGESSGNLENSLGTVADYFEEKVEKRINRLTSLLEPALILVVGLGVGFIAVSMISTIYGLMGSFQ